MFTLHNGDCLEIMPTLEAGSVDAIITDLPYGTTACKWDTIIPFEPMWKEVKRVLKQNGAFITTASQPFTSALIMSNPSWFKYEWIWDKEIPGNPMLAKVQPLKTHENIVVFCEGSPTYNPQMMKSKRRVTQTAKSKMWNLPAGVEVVREAYFPRTIIEFSNADKTGVEHQTQKPLALYEYIIRTYTNEGETILDIAMGSGVTIEAAIKTGRVSIGIEKEKEFFDMAERKAQLAVLSPELFTPSNNRLHMDAGDSPRQPSQSTLEGFTPAEQGTTPAPRQ